MEKGLSVSLLTVYTCTTLYTSGSCILFSFYSYYHSFMAIFLQLRKNLLPAGWTFWFEKKTSCILCIE